MTSRLCTAFKVARWALLPAVLSLFSLSNAHGFDTLSEAQAWIYDRPHLSNTHSGQTVEYSYIAQDADTDLIEDKATLTIVDESEDNLRNVEIDFLSNERNLALPAFSGYRGNPVIIAMLEHIAQDMGKQTGGGVLYFRNRIRDALASEHVKMENSSTEFNDTQLSSTTLTFLPFVNDKYLKDNTLLTNAEFNIELSDDVPAGVVAVGVSAQSGNEVFNRQLSIQ